MIGAPVGGGKMRGFSFINSIVSAGQNPIMSTGGGPLKNCAAQPDQKGVKRVLDDCFSSYEFHDNAIVGGDRSFPKNNAAVKKAEDIGFSSYINGSGGDYHLLSNSRFKRRASDGKDLGADMDAVNLHTGDVH